MEKLLAKAIEIALKAHAGQTDKAGMPYIGHVMRVMQSGKTIDEKIAGILHDIVEDTHGPSTHYWQKDSPHISLMPYAVSATALLEHSPRRVICKFCIILYQNISQQLFATLSKSL